MNNLQLSSQITPEVFARYDRDRNLFELFTLRTFINNINNERIKNKKDAREEFKIVKKNVKSEALKEIVEDLEQAIFGDDDNDEDLLEAEELDRRLKNLISKKRRESLREYLKESEDANPQDRVNALRKKLNNLPKTSDDNNDNNDNDDSGDNQISNFVDKALKKVSKEIVNDDNKDNGDNLSLKSNQKPRKNITEQLKSSENLLDKQIRDAKNKDREKYNRKVDETLKEYYTKEAQSASKETEKFNKMINNDNDNIDSEDKVLKKVSKEIVNDDNKDNGDNISLKSNQKSKENITKQLKSSENLLDKQISDAKKTLELAKKYGELNANSIAETNKMVEELRAENKDREEYSKKVDETLKEYYIKEAREASKEVEKFNKMINNDLDMSGEKSEIINKLIELYSLIQIYYLNKTDNSKANEKIDNVSIFSEIFELKKRLRELRQKGSGMFTSQKEFAKLLTFLAQLHAENSSKMLKNNINQLLKSLYNSKQISELVYKNLITAI